MRRPRMTVAEKRFETLITRFVSAGMVVDGSNRLVDSPSWKMLNKETQDAYLKLIATKTR